MGDHTAQNLYLRGQIESHGTENLSNNTTRKIFRYKLSLNTEEYFVCKKFFLGVHGIKASILRCNVIMKTKLNYIASKNYQLNKNFLQRFKINQSASWIVAVGMLIIKELMNARNAVVQFIQMQEPRESHYSRESNPNKLYLPSGTTKAALYRQFTNTHPELRNENGRHNVTYSFFCQIFNQEFNIAVGYPRSDLCSRCEMLNKKLAISTREQNQDEEILKREQINHWRNAELFYEEMRNCSTLGEDFLVLCFDFEKNFSLPITGLNRQYFLSLASHLNLYNFGIKNLQSGETAMFFYPQNFAKKAQTK